MLLQAEFCFNEQLKMLWNFLYSLEHCIAPRDQYILEVIVNNICNYVTHSGIFVSNVQLKYHAFSHNISVFADICMYKYYFT